jgi:hypothetical protein
MHQIGETSTRRPRSADIRLGSVKLMCLKYRRGLFLSSEPPHKGTNQFGRAFRYRIVRHKIVADDAHTFVLPAPSASLPVDGTGNRRPERQTPL